jgi:hypothetical protein
VREQAIGLLLFGERFCLHPSGPVLTYYGRHGSGRCVMADGTELYLDPSRVVLLVEVGASVGLGDGIPNLWPS